MSKYPECERLAAVSDARGSIAEFLEWCGSQGLFLGDYSNHDLFAPIRESNDAIIMRHFEIDGAKLETERRAMLADLAQGGGS